MPTLAQVLAGSTRTGVLWERLDEKRIRCFACGHRCPIFEGQPGVCKVRFNEHGELRVPWGYAAGVQIDPIEKKPFFHVRPGALALSFGMLGCDLHCGYCQNWVSSQALRDPRAVAAGHAVTPEELVEAALDAGADALVSTYNEPLITAEWAVAVFREAKAAGLLTGFVSNGNATPEVLDYLRPWLDLYKVDLKSFSDQHYRELGGRLEPILDSLRRIYELGFWLEVVTLVVPGFNDSDDELRRIAEFLAGISPEIPWHVTAFHQDYKMTGPRDTEPGDLLRAVAAGRAAGLRYVYAGTLPGAVGRLEDTVCPNCGEAVVRRRGFRVESNRMGREGKCPRCAAIIPGRWAA
ncbi:MAG TPA: AmmeMemoRadiSam system radical SAM enzyme [Bryobacteraceae bacterium]|nr:AmmeMemoRadiSam system radical SAM enzyme [Bryobacteraceae bacterium]